MKFTLSGKTPEQLINFETLIDGDGDLAIKANGVPLGYISAHDGALHLFHLNDAERESINGLSLSNGRLTVA